VGDGATLGRVKKEVFPTAPARSSLQAVWHDSVALERGASFMTEERACHYAKALAHNIGTTFYAVRSREGRFLAVQIPSDDCEILATVMPPDSVNKDRELLHQLVKRAA